MMDLEENLVPEVSPITVYEKATGRIDRVIVLFSMSDLPHNIAEGEDYILSDSDPKTQCVVNGKLQDLPECTELKSQAAWTQVRIERNNRLAECDWTQMPDAPVKNADEWRAYREALRNITETNTDPHHIKWPELPSKKRK